ncbi:plectin/S10 domain-containing protein [Rhizoctonia solani AG-1 IA]|uniref:Plectin/S10 domain-containing protein n=1 Tax=Thanatephorus cucumeris (strain AG1-IA) TaxID=983506 RepID=L8WTK4_THACA|nr:plectin/S10 domain-containing protein [Rhizoctonia solani AG-1 IA]
MHIWGLCTLITDRPGKDAPDMVAYPAQPTLNGSGWSDVEYSPSPWTTFKPLSVECGGNLDELGDLWMDSDCDRASADGRSTTYRTDLCGSWLISNRHFPLPSTMIISKQNRRTIYENLFKGKYCPPGVLVAKKDYNAPKHEDLDVPNLEVIKAMQSLTSKGFVKTQFSWQYYYYTLTNEGLDYLREWCVIGI